MRRHLLTVLTWLLTFAALGGLFVGLFVIHRIMRAELEQEQAAERKPQASSSNDGLVSLEDDEAERQGLETQLVQATPWRERTTVYGRVVPNPRATIEVRSPFAGVLRSAGEASWPGPGRWVHAKQMLGWVDVRVGPDVRLDLQNKLVEARSKQRGAEEEVKLQQDRVNSLKAATARELLARTELDAALVQLTQAKTQLASATAAVELWHKAIEEVEHPKNAGKSLWSQPLTATADGEVTQLAGRPGTAVEAGALLLQLVDFRQPLFRLDLPLELLARGGPPERAAMGIPSLHAALATVEGRLVGPAPRIETATYLVSYLYEAELLAEKAKAHGAWRPGMQVTAQVVAEGATEQPAAAVPREAILYHEGRPLVYVRVQSEKYERREVELLGRDGSRWVVALRRGKLPLGVTPSEVVVTRHAQVLLSREFLAAKAEDD